MYSTHVMYYNIMHLCMYEYNYIHVYVIDYSEALNAKHCGWRHKSFEGCKPEKAGDVTAQYLAYMYS